MNMQSEIKEEIICLCENVSEVETFGLYFVYNERHYFYVPNKDSHFLRFTIPHLAKSAEFDINKVTEAVNETNREVKFVKAVILKNGSISISYDHKLIKGDSIEQIVPHIIKTLDFASNYIINKIK